MSFGLKDIYSTRISLRTDQYDGPSSGGRMPAQWEAWRRAVYMLSQRARYDRSRVNSSQ